MVIFDALAILGVIHVILPIGNQRVLHVCTWSASKLGTRFEDELPLTAVPEVDLSIPMRVNHL